jgi:NADH-ubiquinone oxidoreductase chain 5
MGNLRFQNPVATSSILIANMALCGLPFLAGFYSKDLIIEYILTGGFNFLIVILSLIAVGFTAFYSIRFSLLII